MRHRCPVPEVPFAALPETPPPPHWLERVSWPYLLQPHGPDQRHCPPPAAARQSRLTPTSALIPCAPGYSAPESLPCASPLMLRPLAGWGGEIRRRGLARHPRYCDARRFSSVRRWTTFLEETGNNSTMLFFCQPSLPHLPCRPLFFLTSFMQPSSLTPLISNLNDPYLKMLGNNSGPPFTFWSSSGRGFFH